MSAFCTECGAQLNEGARFCPECGHAVSGAGGGGHSDARMAPSAFPPMVIPGDGRPHRPITVTLATVFAILTAATAYWPLFADRVVRLLTWSTPTDLVGADPAPFRLDWLMPLLAVAACLLLAACGLLSHWGWGGARAAFITVALAGIPACLTYLVGVKNQEWFEFGYDDNSSTSRQWVLIPLVLGVVAVVLYLVRPSGRFFREWRAERLIRRDQRRAALADMRTPNAVPAPATSRNSSAVTAIIAALFWVGAGGCLLAPGISSSVQTLDAMSGAEDGLPEAAISLLRTTMIVELSVASVAGAAMLLSAIVLAAGRGGARIVLVTLLTTAACWAIPSSIADIGSFADLDDESTARFLRIGAALFVVALLLAFIPPTNRYLRNRAESRLRAQVPYVFAAHGAGPAVAPAGPGGGGLVPAAGVYAPGIGMVGPTGDAGSDGAVLGQRSGVDVAYPPAMPSHEGGQP